MHIQKEPRQSAAVVLYCAFFLASVGYAEPPVQAPSMLGGWQLSEEAINLFLARPVDELTKLKNGDQVLANVHTTGQVTAELIPSQDSSIIDIHLTGVTQLLKGAAKAKMGLPNFDSTIDAHKSIFVDLQGLSTEPAVANCEASLKGLAATPLKEQSVAERLRQGAERLASQQTSKRVQKQLDDQVNESLVKAAARLQTQPWLPLEKATTLFEMVNFSTTCDHFLARINGTEDQLPAPTSRRELDPSFDVHLMLHDSLVTAIAKEWFAGKRVQDREVLHHVERMRGRAPWALWCHSRRAAWAVTLDDDRPFAIRFVENKMQLEVRLSSTEIDGRRLDTPVQVSVVLQPEVTVEGHRLRRLVEPEILFLDGKSNPEREACANVLRQKFGAIFPNDIYFDGLKTPSGGAWSKFNRFELAEFVAEQGWFSLAFQLQADELPAMASESATELRR